MTEDHDCTEVLQKPRIIYLSQLFDPEPTLKGLGFIQSIAESGFDIEVVTGFPNYPGGQVYQGYKVKPITRERIGTTSITRLAMYPSHDKSLLRRIITYTSFSLTAFLYLTFRAPKSDLIYVYYPAMTAGLAAVCAQIFRRTPVILDIQDMWPDSLGSSGMMQNRFLLKIADAACNFLYKRCEHIIVLSPGFKRLLIQRGVPEENITIIYNWAEEASVAHDRSLPIGLDPNDRFRILFAGNMGAAQQLDTVIDAAALLKADQPDCIFYFMGSGIERDSLEERAKRLKLSNVRFLPRVNSDQVQKFFCKSDALLVHLNDVKLHRITIPSKTQAYLYAGRPILLGVMGDAADLVRQADAGYLFTSGRPESLANCVRQMISDSSERREELGRNGYQFYMQEMSRNKGIGTTVKLINSFRKIAPGPVS